MSTSQSTIDFILEQSERAGDVSARKMFGEYALYCNGKVVGLVCDDTLFIKITERGKKLVGDDYEEGLPYPGAKPYMVVGGDKIEDAEWMVELITATEEVLPMPKPKKSKGKK